MPAFVRRSNVHVGLPRTVEVVLRNLTTLPAAFNWHEQRDSNADFTAEFTPRVGTLAGKCELLFLSCLLLLFARCALRTCL